MENKRRWPLALGIVLAVVLVCSAIIYALREVPQGGMPVNAVTDGSGGVIVAWQDGDAIRVQHVDASGKISWAAGGTAVSIRPNLHLTGIQPDGTGGAIITWSEFDDSMESLFFNPQPLYAQRISGSGELLWPEIPVFNGWRLEVVPDGLGGAFFACDAFKTYQKALHDSFLRVQRVAPRGARLWGDDGILIVSSSPFPTREFPTYEGEQRIVSDGEDGIIVLWAVRALVGKGENQVYTQRLDRNGVNVWTEPVVSGAKSVRSAESDGAGGVIIFSGYADETPLRSGSLAAGKVFAHVTGEGETLPLETWPPDIAWIIDDGLGGSFHVRVQDRTIYNPFTPRAAYYIERFDDNRQSAWPERLIISEDMAFSKVEYSADGEGGLIVTLGMGQSGQSPLPDGILILRIDASGSMAWGEAGIPVLAREDTKYRSLVTAFSDDTGGIIVAGVLGKGALAGELIYVQRLDHGGNPLWADGVRVNA